MFIILETWPDEGATAPMRCEDGTLVKFDDLAVAESFATEVCQRGIVVDLDGREATYILDSVSALIVVRSRAPLFKHDCQRLWGALPITVHGPFDSQELETEQEIGRLVEHYQSLGSLKPQVIRG